MSHVTALESTSRNCVCASVCKSVCEWLRGIWMLKTNEDARDWHPEVYSPGFVLSCAACCFNAPLSGRGACCQRWLGKHSSVGSSFCSWSRRPCHLGGYHQQSPAFLRETCQCQAHSSCQKLSSSFSPNTSLITFIVSVPVHDKRYPNCEISSFILIYKVKKIFILLFSLKSWGKKK